MRPDQLERLLQVEERLADVFISEADPDQWPGGSAPCAKLTIPQRKERYLWKRAASETAMLLARTQTLMSEARSGTLPDDYDMERQVKLREKQATDLLEKAMARARGVADDAKPAAGR